MEDIEFNTKIKQESVLSDIKLIQEKFGINIIPLIISKLNNPKQKIELIQYNILIIMNNIINKHCS